MKIRESFDFSNFYFLKDFDFVLHNERRMKSTSVRQQILSKSNIIFGCYIKLNGLRGNTKNGRKIEIPNSIVFY